MTPDKIYIQPNAHDGWFEGNKPNEYFTEFIRKDALLEWARNSRDSAGKLSYTEFIDKLNSM